MTDDRGLHTIADVADALTNPIQVAVLADLGRSTALGGQVAES